MIVAGTFLSIGSQLNIRPVLLLLYPILAIFLPGLWEQNNLRIRQIGFFIREHIESKTNGLCWDQFFASGKLKRSNIALFSRGIFAMSQVVAIGMVISRISFSIEELILMTFDLISIIITFIIVKKLAIDFKKF